MEELVTEIKKKEARYSFFRQAAKRLWDTRSARIGLFIVAFFVILAIVVPLAFPYDPKVDSNLAMKLKPPSWEHLFGTDQLGRDVLVRVVHGAPISLRVGLTAVAFGLLVGTFLGMIAGFFRGAIDSIIMRLMDIMLAFPATLLAIAIVAMRGPGLNNTMFAIGIVSVPGYARIARSAVLALQEREFVSAARAIGAKPMRVLFRHILPNGISPLVVQATLNLATAVLEAAALGFLGLGAQPPQPEWGAMLSDSYKFLTIGAWWPVLFPGLAIMLTVLGFNLLGDGLRDALDPRMIVKSRYF
ncbi:MAG: ABC transporter permease [bacterium]|jgi:peptide/nickel transport system permease protein|nr:ABC transporter permease [Caldisericota bacterium]